MKASKADIETVLATMNYERDHADLERAAQLFFPTAVRCEVSQNISNNGNAIESLTFYDEDDQGLSLPTSDGEAHTLVQNNTELAKLYEQGNDPIAFLKNLYKSWRTNFELDSIVFDDYVHFDFSEKPKVAKPLYLALPKHVVLHHTNGDYGQDAFLAWSFEEAQAKAASLAAEAHKDSQITFFVDRKDYKAALEYATETYSFVCDILEVSCVKKQYSNSKAKTNFY